jgi:hypothetical protein
MRHSPESRLAAKVNCPIGDVWWGGWAQSSEPQEPSDFTAEDIERFAVKAEEWRRVRREKLLKELRR